MNQDFNDQGVNAPENHPKRRNIHGLTCFECGIINDYCPDCEARVRVITEASKGKDYVVQFVTAPSGAQLPSAASINAWISNQLEARRIDANIINCEFRGMHGDEFWYLVEWAVRPSIVPYVDWEPTHLFDIAPAEPEQPQVRPGWTYFRCPRYFGESA